MDLFSSPEQELLAQTAADFVARSVDPQALRSLEAGEPGYDPAHWATMTSLGWADLGPLELALVAEQLGRGPLPSPLVVTGSLRNALPALGAEAPPDAVLSIAALAPGAPHEWVAPTIPGGDTISGTFVLVPYAAGADLIVVVTASGLVAIEAAHAGVARRRHDSVGGDPLYRLDCRAVPARPVDGSVDTVLDHLAVTTLAYTVGVADAALGLAVQHAKDRHQFGRPIGSFQAVAHRCADMRAEVEACRMLAYRAAWSLDRDREPDREPGREPDREAEVASALAYANDAMRRVAMHAHQVHGAIGFSTEHDLHLYTRRIKAFELSYGSTALHQERLATAIGLR